MLQILLHSSKTMTSHSGEYKPLGAPLFSNQAASLARLWRDTPEQDIMKLMQVSAIKAAEVKRLYETWSTGYNGQVPAIDAFRGDIYSGLQVMTWTDADRAYAHEHLIILSGLYGALRACDGVQPYRLEMGYKLPSGESMYAFWGARLAEIVRPETTRIINLSAVEYTKALLPHLKQDVITPKFMTISPKTGEPAFVTVHAKVARGAFARWMIQKRIDSLEDLSSFADLGYRYNKHLSTPSQLVFICQTFQGIGLSVRNVT